MENEQKSTNWWLPILIIVILAGIIVGWSYYQKSKQPKENIKIGAVYPLTGNFATYGTEYKRGLEMAIEEINNNGGINGQKFEIIFEDDAGDVTKSVTAINKLIDVDKVKYLFTAFSSTSLATAPIAEKNNILYISATVSKIGNGKTIFRDYWDIEDQGAAIGKAITKEKVKSVGILAMNYGDTEYFLNGVKKTASGVSFVEERFNFGDIDFKTQLTKIKNQNPDAIIIYAFPGAEATKITQQIQELKLDNKRLFAGATTYGLPFMYQPFSETLSEMKAIDSWYSLDVNNPKSKEFSEKYKNKYGQDLVGDAAYPYDDVYALYSAIKDSSNNFSAIDVASNLRKINYNGAAGPLSFDEMGNSKRSSYLQIYTSNGWQKYNIE